MAAFLHHIINAFISFDVEQNILWEITWRGHQSAEYFFHNFIFCHIWSQSVIGLFLIAQSICCFFAHVFTTCTALPMIRIYDDVISKRHDLVSQ